MRKFDGCEQQVDGRSASRSITPRGRGTSKASHDVNQAQQHSPKRRLLQRAFSRTREILDNGCGGTNDGNEGTNVWWTQYVPGVGAGVAAGRREGGEGGGGDAGVTIERDASLDRASRDVYVVGGCEEDDVDDGGRVAANTEGYHPNDSHIIDLTDH